MTDLVRRLATLLAVLVAAVAIGACGGDDDDDDGDGGAGAEARKGGSITIGYTSQPDFLDPALSYTIDGWSAMWLVYMPLVGYKHEEGEAGTEIIPYAAEALPELSEDGLTYTLRLRDGLKYSDGTAAKASDFERTIQRVLNLESGASPFYMKIEGAEEYVEKGDEDGDISGIETNDETREITIKLTERSGDFLQILSMNFAGLVPGDTPFRNLTKDPPPGLGPYQITESVPNRQFVMERNPNFNIPGIPEGNVDKITAKIVGSEARQAQQVIRGDLDFMFDPPPTDQKPQIRQRYSDRYEEFTTISTYYFWMNNRIPPFDDPKVREAVNIGLDKTAISRITGGEITPGCSFLPPGMAGYDEGLDLADCPFGDPRQPPDVERARQLLEEAGASGEKITVWGNDEELTRKVTQEYESQLKRLGFETELQIIDGGVYFQTIGNERTDNLHTGFANWFQDYPHPANFFFLVSGDSIQPTNNQNFGNVDNPEITRETNELEVEPELTDEVAGRWGELNRKLVEGAFIAPYGHRALSNFESERMNFDCALIHPVMQVDYSTMCLK